MVFVTPPPDHESTQYVLVPSVESNVMMPLVQVAPDFDPELCGLCVRPAGCGIEKLARPKTCHS